MLFNSIEFAIFLPIVFLVYWFVINKNLRFQNLFILISSYIFYGWWDYRFLALIVISSTVDFFVAKQIHFKKKNSSRKLFLIVSIAVNLGLLAFFKYYNFFIDSFTDAFLFFGKELDPERLNIILPVGISFYTFQTLSYTIDVYRKKLEPTSDIISFFAFVAFFPQLVAGPIERAKNLLPQFSKPRLFNYHNAVDGLRQIIWGLFKKVVVADSCANYVDFVFKHYPNQASITLIVAAVLFAIQIYGDFSGYSDIAIGTARLFGFNLMQNFAFPYFSRDIAEFWRRWHISLSTWFRDYVYIPLGGSRTSKIKIVRNIFIIFIVSGFWHGANWTFLVWGALNALFFLPLMLLKTNRKNTDTVKIMGILSATKNILSILLTFSLTCFAWVFFRASSIDKALQYIQLIFTENSKTGLRPLSGVSLLGIGILIIFEWINREKQHGLDISSWRLKRSIRWGVYVFLVFEVILYSGMQKQFIYFQF